MVCFIAPYEKMKLIADSLKGQFDIPINTVVANLKDAIDPAREALADGAIIVSRGGTAKLIRETFGIDVIEVDVSQYELIRVLRPFINTNRKVAVVGFRLLSDNVERMCRILDIPIISLPVDNETEVESRIRMIADQKIDCVIGDMISIRSAKGIHAELHLIESDEYAVMEALSKAALIAKSIRLQRENDMRVRAIFNSVQEAIISVDRNGIVDQANLKASELLGLPGLHGKSMNTFIHDKELFRIMGEGSEISGKVEDINGRRTVVNVTPLVMKNSVQGAVIVLQEVGKIQALEKKVRKQLYAKGLAAKYTFQDIFTDSPSMRSCIEIARQYAATDSNIVIYGETGTGKELLAQSIHNASPVRDGPFVAINCGALPPSLLESELFGYAEGAFTGAIRGGKVGLFELAHNGTIFLDEINELDFQLQAKLLRVLQEREVMRVGDTKIIPVSVRIIAASNVPLQEEMEKGRFRKDLYYRLNVLEIEIPPLRKRPGDIQRLFSMFIEKCAAEKSVPVPDHVPDGLLHKLAEYDWPGNVRELENISERYMVLYHLLGDQAAAIIAGSIDKSRQCQSVQRSRGDFLNGSLKEIEDRIIREVFEQEEKNITRTAKRLRLDRQTVRKRLAI